MKLFLTIISCFLLNLRVHGQGKVFYSSSDVDTLKYDVNIKDVKPSFLSCSDFVTIHYTNSSKRRVSKNLLWGYESKGKHIYRIYENKLFEMIERGQILTRYKRSTKFSEEYISNTLDGPIIKATANNREKLKL